MKRIIFEATCIFFAAHAFSFCADDPRPTLIIEDGPFSETKIVYHNYRPGTPDWILFENNKEDPMVKYALNTRIPIINIDDGAPYDARDKFDVESLLDLIHPHKAIRGITLLNTDLFPQENIIYAYSVGVGPEKKEYILKYYKQNPKRSFLEIKRLLLIEKYPPVLHDTIRSKLIDHGFINCSGFLSFSIFDKVPGEVFFQVIQAILQREDKDEMFKVTESLARSLGELHFLNSNYLELSAELGHETVKKKLKTVIHADLSSGNILYSADSGKTHFIDIETMANSIVHKEKWHNNIDLVYVNLFLENFIKNDSYFGEFYGDIRSHFAKHYANQFSEVLRDIVFEIMTE